MFCSAVRLALCIECQKVIATGLVLALPAAPNGNVGAFVVGTLPDLGLEVEQAPRSTAPANPPPPARKRLRSTVRSDRCDRLPLSLLAPIRLPSSVPERTRGQKSRSREL